MKPKAYNRGVVIVGATADDCEFCKGIVYKLMLNKSEIIYQCKDCGNTFKKQNY